MRGFIIILFFLLTVCTQVIAQEYTIMFYNTENLFDTLDDTLKDDAEFLPEGSRRWTHYRYWHKIDAVSRVIVAAGGWETPLIVGLCEVENLNVARDMVNRSLLANAGYKVVHRESPDSRGIDLCLLYRSDIVRVADSRSWVPEMKEGEVFDSRNLLYVKTVINEDSLHIILCHWPSRRGGTLASEGLREKMALLVRSKIDSIQAGAEGKASILVMGDFNATAGEPVMSILSKDSCMINLTHEKASAGEGSYRYHGMWEMIDQVLVSRAMTDTTGSFTAGSDCFTVFDEPFLLVDDPDYPGERPFSTFSGFTWSGGYSDHLPVLVKITHH